jgi:hypothetical protein
MRRFRQEKHSAYDIPRPPYRRLRIFSLDPSLALSLETAVINTTTIAIPWECHPEDADRDGPAPGPVGEYLEVIDYDPASGCYYKPLDLNDPYLLAEGGLAPADGNPQFHQQMVYAVAMRTIGNFERALGRRALWSPRRWRDQAGKHHAEYVGRLRIYPHALREPNAYYSPAKKALLFGYFQATPNDPARHLPGATVFTCLSHDVVAHETAHALLDGMHRRFTEATNPDVLAFHEAFADIVALFQHFSFPQVLEHIIARTRGDLSADNQLAKLAHEFGRAIGRTDALRSAIGVDPDPALLERVVEPHQRGSILVAAIFDAFLAIYRQRSADLVRLASEGSGVLRAGALHPDLVRRLADEAAKASQHVLTMCLRALDYLPPLDVTFGDYLRALITADFDLVPNDDRHYRIAFIEAFRRRGIYPRDVRSLSEESLRWMGPDLATGQFEEAQIFLGRDLKDTMRSWHLDGERHSIYEQMREARKVAHGIIDKSRHYKSRITVGLDLDMENFEVHAIRPVRRSGPDGQLLLDAVVEVTQRFPGYFNKPHDQCRYLPPPADAPDFWFRGGCTLIVDLDSGRLRYCIYKDIKSASRYERQKAFLSGHDAVPSLYGTYFGALGGEDNQEIFSFLHRAHGEEAI